MVSFLRRLARNDTSIRLMKTSNHSQQSQGLSWLLCMIFSCLHFRPPAFGRRGKRPKSMVATEDRLLLCLTWLAHAEAFHLLAANFGLKKTSCQTVIRTIPVAAVPILAARFTTLRTHQNQQDEESLIPNFTEFGALVDATILDLSRPVGEHGAHYNGYKKRYCMKNLCLHSCAQ